jgi:uncharacterized protein (TIGR02001 family)
MRLTKKMFNMQSIALAGAMSVSLGVLPNVVQAQELTGNIGFTSNYIWRGVSQTDDAAAISGGIDYGHDAGIYLGTWISNTTSAVGPETDLYIGFAKDFGYDWGLDVGYIAYIYAQSVPDIDFEEFYVGGSWKMISAQYSDDGDNNYIEAAVDFEIAKDLGLALHYGSYSFDISAGDYTDYSVTLSKGDWGFALSGTDIDNDDYRLFVSYSTTVDLLK